MKKIVYYLKQLLPFQYESNFIIENEVKCFTTWNMWFGHCFNINFNKNKV